jgi:hypothetical protein
MNSINRDNLFLTERFLSLLPNEATFPINSPPSNLEDEYHQAKIGFEHLFDCKQIEKRNENMGLLPNIQQDRYFIASTDEFSAVGIGGLGPCFGIAFFAETSDGKKFFGGAHQSFQQADEVLSFITNELLNRNCTKQSIEFYVVGGWLDEGCLNVEKDFLELSRTYSIKGLCFNLIVPDASDESSAESSEALQAVDMVVQADKKIIYGLDNLFLSNQDIGNPLGS